MKKVVFLLFFSIFSITVFANQPLKKVNLPENWKIENVETQSNFELKGQNLSFYTKETIKTPQGQVIVHLYECKDKEQSDILFQMFLQEKITVFRKNNSLYQVEGEVTEVKNTLRFLELPLEEQVKVFFSELVALPQATIISEQKITPEIMETAKKQLGIEVRSGLRQILSVEGSKARLQVTFYVCKNASDARLGFNNGRMYVANDLTSFVFAEEFLVELRWVK